MIVFAIYIGIKVVIIALSLWGRVQVVEFLKRHREIQSWQDLEEFIALVRPQMYLALASIPLWLVSFILFWILVYRFGILILFIGLFLDVATLMLAQVGKKSEQRSRNLTCATEELEYKYKQIAKSWTDDAFPKF
ncbi:MAG: hypothetical protein ACPGVO_22540 [Spirulinaceae cyanobacterium]